ncbi:MAG TPA: glycosyltransferase [Paludibaculum sp.]|jgi:cellulose synthase/poly-beta-1,6-N-acetylglucosamine synthase-like glycosyltransferase/peptidoglycan/xylan/chitin deacetylase (PgdA/CDA1 family)/spore germination protein YaaH
MQSRFVFHDPTGRRWVRVRRALGTGGIILLTLISLVALAALSSPHLPRMGLPEVQRVSATNEVPSIIRGEQADVNVPYKAMKTAARQMKYVRGGSVLLRPVSAPVATPEKPVVLGFYVNWDRASMVSLRLNLRHITHLAPEWLVLANAKGDLTDETDNAVVDVAHEAKLPILVMVTNFRNGWRGDDLHKLLNNKQARDNLIDNIYSNIAEHHFAGVMIDLEQTRKDDRPRLVQFMTDLRSRLKPAGLMMTQSVPTEDEAYDLNRLAELNDLIVPMVYDEHYQSGKPGPVASQEWFARQLDALAGQAPSEKMLIGVGNYGYDWIIGAKGGEEVSFNDVMAAAVANKAMPQWDVETQNTVLRYTNRGRKHEVWYLDAVTGLNHVRAVKDRGFRGIGVWRLGGEDPELWRVVRNAEWPGADFDVKELLTLRANRTVNQYGEGEVIRIADTPREGSRRVWRDNAGLFAEEYVSLPTYYVVESYGKSRKKHLAITFDDGPDPEYTPRILDVLKEKRVKATFFVVGANAESQPELLRRIYAEGSEIGNHTYSHPNIALTSPERTRLELDATQRIIENAIHRSTILFRPPYNADSEPQTPEEIEPVRRAQEMGYLTVGERIDPQDWREGTTDDEILADVIEEKDGGNIILLHDAGGDRTATVKALPRIIDHFQAEGYRFFTVGELLGKSRDETMPLPDANERHWALIEGGALDLKGLAVWLMGVVFISAILLTAARSLIFAVMAVLQKRMAARRVFDADFQPPVSVLIAAFNEEKVIHRTVHSVLSSNYPALNVVVVDDGSTDATLAVLRNAFADDPRVTVLTQVNGGKSAALNRAIAAASHEILVTVDADTLFAEHTIGSLVRHFHDPRVGAVSGNAKVGNRHNWLTRFQSIEYIYGFNLDRRALELVNAITVVPGAVGAWRKSLVVEMGGLSHDTLAEDTDLTLAIRRAGYEIRYEAAAVAYTEAPEDLGSLAKQRFRWAFGTLQAAWKHRDATFNPKYGTLGFVALPSIWIFQVMLAALSPFADIAMVATLVSGNWHVVLAYYFAFFLVELLAGVLAYGLEGDSRRDLTLLFFQRVFYRQLMHYVLIKSVLYAAQGRLVGWGKLERKASVQKA